MAQIYNLIFNCTPAQFAVATATTLPTAAFTVIQAPIPAQGTIKHATYGQIDFSYDGAYFLRFFGANPIPVAEQASAGIPQNQMSPQLVTELTSIFAATLGAPVPSNQAIPAPYLP